MKVEAGIAGSHCVVFLGEGNDPGYIDARMGRSNTFTVLELVHGGQVVKRCPVPNSSAPELIIKWMRQHAAKNIRR
jgi:hypothetical protein